MSPEDEKRLADMMNRLPNPEQEVMTRGRAEKEYVTRGEFEQFLRNDRRLFLRLAVWIVIVTIMLVALTSATCRADTTKVFQAKPRTWGITVPPGATIESTKVIYDSTGPGICITFPPIFVAVKIDGKWFPLKWLVDSLPPMYPDSVVRARGFDSTFNLQEKVWYYYDWLNGKRVNMRRVK